MNISERQRQFCHEYMKDFCATAAMRRAGYSPKTAEKSAYRLLEVPSVAFYLKGLMDKLNEKHELNAELVVEQIRRLAFADILNYYHWCEESKSYKLKRLEHLTAAQRAPIASYSPETGYTFYSKDPSLDKLAKFYKLYSDIDQTITNYVLMPELKLNGKPMEFNIGEPVPRRDKKG